MGNNKKSNWDKPFYNKDEKKDESFFEKATETENVENESEALENEIETVENEIETVEIEPEISEEEIEVVVNESVAKEAPETNVKKTQRFIKLTPSQHRIRLGNDVVFYKKDDILELPLEVDADRFLGSLIKEWKRI